MTNDRGGRPSGPCQDGPPCEEMSTKSAFRSLTTAMMSEHTRVMVIELAAALRGRRTRRIMSRRRAEVNGVAGDV
jgi:hypothetical protein